MFAAMRAQAVVALAAATIGVALTGAAQAAPGELLWKATDGERHT
jgi:hypothetical protein